MNKTSATAIRLTSSGWWKQIDDLQMEGKLPHELGCLLKGLIGSHLSKTIPPAATPNLIKLAEEHLQGGVELSDSATDNFFDVMVYTPNPGQEEVRRHFFVLIRKYPEGRLKYLDEF